MAAEDVDPEESILILKRRSLNVMAANQPESVIAGLATRRTTTLLSSAGGTGKTCLLTQAAIESSQDRPVWGNAEFHSNGPRRWLYMNAEDSLQSIDYWLARILARYDLQECPVDIMPVCETKTGEFLFSSDNAQSLARRINAERYDGLIIDTGIAVMTPGTRFIDPLSIRGWLRSSVGILQRETQAAIIVAVHDNKAGQPVSGTADWLSFARLALHLETAGQSGRETTLTLTTIKANLRWPYKKITLVRDPHSLTATVAAIERVGDLDATPSTPQDVNALLTKIVRNQIIPLPSEERTSRRVEALVYEKARNSRIKRQTVRDFLDNHVVFEERPFGRTRGMVAVGIRDYAEETP